MPPLNVHLLLEKNLGPPTSRILDLVHHEDRLERLDAVPPEEDWERVEGPVAYDRCLLWNRQHRYFANRGARAWTAGDIPSLGTGSPGVARQHASLVHQALIRLREAGRLRPRVTLLELGSGPGLFAWNFMQALLELDRKHATNFYPQIRFLYSDYSARVVDDARAHPLLRPRADAGRMDFLCLDAVASKSAAAAAADGLVAIFANYLHCCLPLTVVRRGANDELLEKKSCSTFPACRGRIQPVGPPLRRVGLLAPVAAG